MQTKSVTESGTGVKILVVLESDRCFDVSLHVCISINDTCLMQEANESVLKFCTGCCPTKTMQKRISTKPSVVSVYFVGIKEVLVYGKSENMSYKHDQIDFMRNTWHKFVLADVFHRFHWTLMLVPWDEVQWRPSALKMCDWSVRAPDPSGRRKAKLNHSKKNSQASPLSHQCYKVIEMVDLYSRYTSSTARGGGGSFKNR